ncbi:hypothetical protein LguiB_035000 [Lonicera macranthoides]
MPLLLPPNQILLSLVQNLKKSDTKLPHKPRITSLIGPKSKKKYKPRIWLLCGARPKKLK